MRFLYLLLASTGIAFGFGCSQPGTQVNFVGGFDTDSRDHGRPVILIGSALGVTEDVFRDAFRGVTPSRNGPPSHSEARANKEVLMNALGKHGITNERLDEVSNYYRYRREAGETWKHTPATATAIVEDGEITGFNIVNAGSGYSSSPSVKVAGYDNLRTEVTIEFSTDFSQNGRVVEIDVLD